MLSTLRLHVVGCLLAASLMGCQSGPAQPTLAESFQQLKRGMKPDEVVALMGEPHARSDGPQVAVSDRDPTKGKSVLTPEGRYIEAKDPASRAIVAFLSTGMSTTTKEPASFSSGAAVEIDAQGDTVNWLYRPDLGRRRSGNVQDKSLIMLTFKNSQLFDAMLVSH
jgi:hypothetical protein